MIPPMKTLCAIGLFVLAAGVNAQQPGFSRTVIQRGDLSTPGREVVSAIAEFQPGATSGPHTHPGEEAGIKSATVRVGGSVAEPPLGGESLDQRRDRVADRDVPTDDHPLRADRCRVVEHGREDLRHVRPGDVAPLHVRTERHPPGPGGRR